MLGYQEIFLHQHYNIQLNNSYFRKLRDSKQKDMLNLNLPYFCLHVLIKNQRSRVSEINFNNFNFHFKKEMPRTFLHQIITRSIHFLDKIRLLVNHLEFPLNIMKKHIYRNKLFKTLLLHLKCLVQDNMK